MPSSAPRMRADRCGSFIGSLANPISSTAFRCIESLVSCLEQVARAHRPCHRCNAAAERNWDARIVEDELMLLTSPAKVVAASYGVLVSGFGEDKTQLLSTVTCQAFLA